jgi:ASC-1-like (ASCH) protein
MADLHLNLKGEYFDQIKAGTKLFEFRSFDKWSKRLEGKTFDRIFIKRGYPKRTDASKIIERPWRGYEQQTITHSHFGSEPVEVFAIRVN